MYVLFSVNGTDHDNYPTPKKELSLLQDPIQLGWLLLDDD